MERKYYLRGLGLGIAVTAIIMGFALPDSRAMTNDEIISRAKELGLVENTVLSSKDDADSMQENEGNGYSDMPGQSQDDLAKADSADSVTDTDLGMEDSIAKENGDTAEVEDESASKANNAGQEDADLENVTGEADSETEEVIEEEEQENAEIREENSAEAENANGTDTSSAVKVITIISGDSSYTVAKKLADVGVVTSAQNFDAYLCQNGYDKRLRTGSFTIPADASDEKIARIVTGLE